MSEKFHEFEVKFTISGVDLFKKQLRKLDVIQLKDVIQIDEYLTDEQQTLSARDHLLRVRKEFDTNNSFRLGEFSWKGPRRGNQIEIREDLSIPFSSERDLEAFRTILNKLGYQTLVRFTKFRERWQLNGFNHEIAFELDKEVWSEVKQVPKLLLGSFCQASLETYDEISDSRATNLLWKIIESLGYTRTQYEPRTYIELHFDKKGKES